MRLLVNVYSSHLFPSGLEWAAAFISTRKSLRSSIRSRKRWTSLFSPRPLSFHRIYPQVQHALTSDFRRACNSSCTFFRDSFIIRNGTPSSCTWSHRFPAPDGETFERIVAARHSICLSGFRWSWKFDSRRSLIPFDLGDVYTFAWVHRVFAITLLEIEVHLYVCTWWLGNVRIIGWIEHSDYGKCLEIRICSLV